jgi:hypothetical protein
MNGATSRWQILLLVILTFALGGTLWWRVQPAPPAPTAPPPISPEQTTPNHSLKSTLLPGISFSYPVSRELNDPDRFEYNGICAKQKEAFFWEYDEVLAVVGASKEIINMNIYSINQIKYHNLIKQRDNLLDKFFSKVIQDFYESVKQGGKKLLGTGTMPVPNGTTIARKTFGHNDTLGLIKHNGKYYGTFFESYSSLRRPESGVLALAICQLYARPR